MKYTKSVEMLSFLCYNSTKLNMLFVFLIKVWVSSYWKGFTMSVKNQNKSHTGILIFAIIVVVVFLFNQCSSQNKEYKDTVRCSFCSKVIRYNGTNIHGTPIYNGGTLKCDYCGHKTNIY